MITFIKQSQSERVAVYVVLFSLLWLALTLSYMLELPKVRIFIHHHGKWFQAALLILQPALSFMMIEIMVSNYNTKMFQSYGIYNIAWYCVIIFLPYVILRSARLAILISNLVIYLAGVLNYLVYLFRGNPIIPSDLLAWQTGMSVASNYQVSFTIGFIIATIIMYSIMIIGSKMEEGQVNISFTGRLVGVAIYSIFATVIFLLFFHTDIIKTQISVIDFFAPKYTYCTYGTAFGFVANVEAMEVEEPEGYTTDIVQKLLSEAETTPTLAESVAVKPNVIAIMNEAFSDPRLFGDYQTNIDFLPSIDSLEENTIKGTMYTSVFGGATSDTEYEFLTGNSMAVMPQNCVPYQQFITDSRDSLAATLKAQGYYNIAIHPYAPSGYKRDLVYPLLGFDEFLSKEDFQNPQMIRSYISDRESYKKIIEQYEMKGDQPLFIFNVTMQNHGGYSGERLFDEKDTVRLTQLQGYDKVEQYLSLLRESDKAFQTLVDYFSRVEEPTIILLFGDHQPVVYSELHNRMESKPSTTIAELDKPRYAVPFIMWANYNIAKDDVDNISANYLSSYLLKTAGLPGTAYNEYLLQLQKDLPVINAHFYITKEGECYPLSETTTYSELLRRYQYVGYNNALDNKNKLWEYYQLRP
jgi:phosphoglycerol transferase MdoB-like AlkP superfamily enzyme